MKIRKNQRFLVSQKLKISVKILIIGIIFLLSLVAVNAATVSHSAGQITPGGFQVGSYNFPGVKTKTRKIR